MELYDRIMDRELLIRRMYLAANKVVPEEMIQEKETFEQLDLFTDYAALESRSSRKRLCWSGNAKCRKPCWILRKIREECNSEGNESAGGCYGQRQKFPDRRS